MLTKTTDARPAYIHSIAVTGNYVFLTIWQADFAFYGLATLRNRNILDGLAQWDDKRLTLQYMIDRLTGEIVGKFTSAPMFSSHHINAYEEDREDGAKDVVVDMSTYADISFVSAGKVESMRNFKRDQIGLPRYHRFLLSLTFPGEKKPLIGEEAIVVVWPWSDINVELACMNPLFQHHKARNIYGSHHTQSSETNDVCFDSIIKIDRDHPALHDGDDPDK